MSQTTSMALPAEEVQTVSSASEPGPSRAPLEEVDLNIDSRQSSVTVDGEVKENDNESEDEEDEEAAEDDLDYVEKEPVRAPKVTKENGGVKRKRKRRAAGAVSGTLSAKLAAARELSQIIKGVYDDLGRIGFGPSRPATKSVVAILTIREPRHVNWQWGLLLREWREAKGRFEGHQPGEQIIVFSWGEGRGRAVGPADLAKLEKLYPTQAQRQRSKTPRPSSPSPDNRSPSMPAPDGQPFTMQTRTAARSSVRSETREAITADIKPDISSFTVAQPIHIARAPPPGPAVADTLPTPKEVIKILAAYAEVWDAWSVPEVVDLLVTETEYTDKTFWGRQVFDYRKRRGAFASVPPLASARSLKSTTSSASRAGAGYNASGFPNTGPHRGAAPSASPFARSKTTKNRDGVTVYELLDDDQNL